MVKIGLECHVQLNTRSKIFCSCPNPANLQEKNLKPNSLCCPQCLGLPGAKPVFNKKVLEEALKVALALKCKINEEMFFSRKTYYFPDLPNSYQITQYEEPLAIKGSFQSINITRLHMEEDPGKLIHQGNLVLIDYNRSGVPLIEIVTEPEFTSPTQAKEFLQNLLTLLEYLGVYNRKSEASLRVDANISTTGPRVEIKNIGSIKEVEKALNSEIKRQQTTPPKEQETRGWDTNAQSSILMRTKESEMDYGYIIEPNLTKITISKEQIKQIKSTLPELQDQKEMRFLKQYKVKSEDAKVLTQDLKLADLFEKTAKKIDHNLTSRWFVREIPRILNYNKLTLDEWDISEKEITELLDLLQNNKITERTAQKILEKLSQKKFSPKEYAEKEDLLILTSKGEIDKLVDKAIKENPKAVQDYKNGEEKALNFLFGKVMRLSRNTADPYKVKELLIKKLK
ncbi:MAG: Asp-tRNA(Asn)/Glu-tRNA(Gln) amidotransferase subunit GatB [Candidatus Woesearchaeota archaeon]